MHGEMRLDFSRYRRLVLGATSGGIWVWRVLGTIMVVLSVLALLGGGGLGSNLLVITAGVYVALFCDLRIVWRWRRLSRLAGRPWRYDIDDAGVSVHTSVTDVRFGWDGIRAVRARPHAWILRTVAGATVAIPRAAFSPQDAARIDERFATLARA